MLPSSSQITILGKVSEPVAGPKHPTPPSLRPPPLLPPSPPHQVSQPLCGRLQRSLQVPGTLTHLLSQLRGGRGGHREAGGKGWSKGRQGSRGRGQGQATRVEARGIGWLSIFTSGGQTAGKGQAQVISTLSKRHIHTRRAPECRQDLMGFLVKRVRGRQTLPRHKDCTLTLLQPALTIHWCIM